MARTQKVHTAAFKVKLALAAVNALETVSQLASVHGFTRADSSVEEAVIGKRERSLQQRPGAQPLREMQIGNRPIQAHVPQDTRTLRKHDRSAHRR
jgi:hypothetical protein